MMTWLQWLQWLLLAAVLVAGIVALLIRQRMGARSRRNEPLALPEEDPMQVGLQLFGQGRFQEAASALESSLSDHGELPDVRYALGVSLLRSGRAPHAWNHLEKAIRADPVYLQYLVTRPETESVRDQPRFEAFIRRQAKQYQDHNNQGYQ